MTFESLERALFVMVLMATPATAVYLFLFIINRSQGQTASQAIFNQVLYTAGCVCSCSNSKQFVMEE
jgi:predicted acyltransferase